MPVLETQMWDVIQELPMKWEMWCSPCLVAGSTYTIQWLWTLLTALKAEGLADCYRCWGKALAGVTNTARSGQLRRALCAVQRTSVCANTTSLLGPHPPGTAASPQSKLIPGAELMEQQNWQSFSHPTWGHGSQEPYGVVPGLPFPGCFPSCNTHICLNLTSAAALLQGQGPWDLCIKHECWGWAWAPRLLSRGEGRWRPSTQEVGLGCKWSCPMVWGKKVSLFHSVASILSPLHPESWCLIAKDQLQEGFHSLAETLASAIVCCLEKAQSRREGRSCSEAIVFSEKASEAKGIKFEWVLGLFHINLLAVNQESLYSSTSDYKCPSYPSEQRYGTTHALTCISEERQ